MNDTQTSDGVGLLKKGFQILDSFTMASPSWTQTDLARATGFTKSTTSRLVRYLCEAGYLTQATSSGRYQLGPAAMDLGRRASALFNLAEMAQPVLERLAAETHETIILTEYLERRSAAVCVYQIESQRDGLRVFENVGAEFRLTEGAAPRAILAAIPDADREALLAQPLRKRGSGSLTTPDAVRAATIEAQRAGYAVSREETYDGVVGVAAAIRWPNGLPAGSVAIAAPLLRYDENGVAKLGSLVAAAAREIDVLLSGPSTVGAAR